MLTEKERLQKVMKGEKADRRPCICPGGMMNMVTAELMERSGIYLPQAHTDSEKMAALAMAVNRQGCFENVGVPFCMTIEAEMLGAKVDMGSAVHEPHITEYPITSVEEYQMLKPIRLEEGRAKVVIDALGILKKQAEGIPIVGNLTGPISVATSLLEPTTFYKEMRKKNAQAHAFMEFVTDQLIAFGQAQLNAGADVIAISDPSGTGELLGPKYFEEFSVKYINRLLQGLDMRGKGSIVHICGQMRPVYEKAAKICSDVLSFDSIVSMKEARQHFQNHALMGNVSTYTLEFGEAEDVKRLTRMCCQGGADILAPACGLGMKSPLKNVQAILEYVKEEETCRLSP
ncbi:MAG: MtaA/CmuA family methyltransferase [Eubacteriales bacterium]|nr:MtaA/CmuA family methyltransferase [Eubacteriales bacterium]